MKNKKTPLLAGLALVCLLVIGGVLSANLLRNRKRIIEKNNHPQILGENIQPQDILNLPSSVNIDQFVQNTVQDTKEKVVLKATEVEEVILQTINKEIKKLSESQIEALKLQICRDLGVITVAPTQAP